jgi:hypothetical protein
MFYVLLTAWIVVVLMWLYNTFYYQNQRRELAYRKARQKAKQAAAAD